MAQNDNNSSPAPLAKLFIRPRRPQSDHTSPLAETDDSNRACKWVTIYGVTLRDWSLLGTKRDKFGIGHKNNILTMDDSF